MALPSYSGVFVFGDSLVDAGNALAAARTYDLIPFKDLPDGAPTANLGYWEGRFTDGPTFADLISNKFIAKLTKPVFPFGFVSYPFQGDPNGNNLNFAYGGAEIRNESGDRVPDIDDQTDAYRDAVDGDADQDALHLFVFGGNDIHDLVPKSGAWVDEATAIAILQKDANEWIEEIRQTIDIGARHVLALGVPDVGIQPYYNGTADEAQRRAVATHYGEILDGMIRAQLSKLQLPGVDFHFVGFTDMADDLLRRLGFNPDDVATISRSSQIFFDKVHPTAQLHAMAAAYLIDDLSGVPAGDVIALAAPDYRMDGAVGITGEVDKLVVLLPANATFTMELLGISSGKLTAQSFNTLADPTLRVIGPPGTVVAVNDDGGQGLDARVQFTTSVAGSYTIELSGVGKLTGAYRFQADNQTFQNNVYAITSSATLVIEGPGGGNDRVNSQVSYALAPGSSIETLATSNGAGTAPINLTGNELGQKIIGNAGANLISGMGGNDVLVGGLGSDIFLFRTAPGPGNIDTVTDFSARDDSIWLDHGLFAGLSAGPLPAGAFRSGTAALDADDRILFDPVSHRLTFDADGNGPQQGVLFATVLGTDTNLTASDFFLI